MRNKALYFSIKYDGNYDKIDRAIKNNYKYEKIKTKDQFITIYDELYPKQLLQLKKPPYVLFYKGNIELLHMPCVSIVGSRIVCDYAIKYTKIVSRMISSEAVVVSGLAKGIDSVAHQSAMIQGKTIAVLGSGINYIYPKSNTRLYEKICKDHLVISEYPDRVVPKPYFFPFRNRIIAALSDSVYVMQAGMRSGTMLTVNEALELNKDIYVLPYRINDEYGSGCNYLIQQGANLILTDDVGRK